MTVRAGVYDLIQRLRGMTAAGTAEFSVNSEPYWSHDHLAAILDDNSFDVFREPLRFIPTVTDSGQFAYYDAYFTYGNVERDTSGTAIWQVEGAAGSAYSTADYTVNYQQRHIRFNNNMNGTALWLNYRYFNLEQAASDVWDYKAAHVADRYDVKTDNHDLKRSQLYDMFTKEAKKWRDRALTSDGATEESILVRSDLNTNDDGIRYKIRHGRPM